jgi:YYY domain-containing protein
MANVLAFWAAAMLIAALAWPIAAVVLRRLPDAGAGLSFPLGLLLSGYAYFALRVLQVLPVGRGGYLVVIVLLALASAAVAGRDRWLRVTWWRAWPGIVIAAGVFTFAFFGYVSFRSYNSEIGGTEQPMDLMYLNATMHSSEYPPKDPWLSGEHASYYYFGYLQAGVLTSVAGVPASSGYNLSLAYTFAAAAAGIASLAYALARWLLGSRGKTWAMAAGGLAVALLLFVGSLSAVFEWAAAHDSYNRTTYDAFGVEWLIPCDAAHTTDCFTGPVNPRTTHWYPTEFWFWWRGSRVIPNTITEFPFFSFLLGDLHPHVMSIPLILLVLGVSAATWRGRSRLNWDTHRHNPANAALLAILLGALAFQNAWDVITFTLVLSAAVFARNWRRGPPWQALLTTGAYVGIPAVAALALYSPWALTFSSQAQGLKPYEGAGTRPPHLLLQFGPLLLCGLLIAGIAYRHARRSEALNIALATAWVPLIPFLLWILYAGSMGHLSTAVDARTAGGFVTLGIYAAVLWLLCFSTVTLSARRDAAALPAALAALAVLLLYGSELFLIKDVFFGSVPRLNTIFKLSYQAWILLSLAGGVSLAIALRELRSRWSLAPAAVPIAALTSLGFVYPVLAAYNRTEDFSLTTNIDGLAAVQRADPEEYALARWVSANTPDDAVLLEATGRRWSSSSGAPALTDPGTDYGDGGRISGRTGRSTPIGWYFHEIQWRGDNAANRTRFVHRQDEVDAAYYSGDPERVIGVMKEFGAQYLVVGQVELSRYPGMLPDFSKFLDVAFKSGSYAIYRLPVYETVHTS